MKERIKKFLKDEQGTQVTETALVLGFISVAAIALLTAMSGSIVTIYTAIRDALAAAAALAGS